MKLFRLLLILFIGLIISNPGYAEGPRAMTDLDSALEKAGAEDKMLFIQYGRERCGNCRALKDYVANGGLRLSDRDFVYVDLNCDDPKTKKAFKSRYTVKGLVLPLVVIADFKGRQLVARSGYGGPIEYARLIKAAKRKNRGNSLNRRRTTPQPFSTEADLESTTGKKKKTIDDIKKLLAK